MSRADEIQDRLDVLNDQINPLISEREQLLSELAPLILPPTSFGFLYSRKGLFDEDDLRERVYKAQTLSEAAEKFARYIATRDWPDLRVDSEADHNGSHVDLYAIGESHPLYKYLP